MSASAITAHPKINTISFTGGTVTGRKVAEACAPLFKKVSLELGGKNPNIVFADADLDAAIAGSVRSSFANQGQVCLCGSRVFVERSAYKDFVERFIERTAQLCLGDPLDEKTEQGAIVNKTQLDKVKFYVDLAQKEGGKIALGGSAPQAPNERCREGYFFQPTVITDLPVSCRTNREEIFGPVVTITPFDSEDEVINYANDVEYGLSSSVWTQNLSRAHRVAERINTGTVWVNCWLVRDLRVPFGGMKQSGVGREGGEEALRFFTEAEERLHREVIRKNLDFALMRIDDFVPGRGHRVFVPKSDLERFRTHVAHMNPEDRVHYSPLSARESAPDGVNISWSVPIAVAMR